MAEVFGSTEAYVAGGTTDYNLVKDNRFVNPILGKTTPCEDACLADYRLDMSDVRVGAWLDLWECGIITGAVVAFSRGVLMLPAATVDGFLCYVGNSRLLGGNVQG